MSRFCIKIRSGTAGAATFCVAAGLLTFAGSAQELPELRGAVAESEINAALLRQPATPSPLITGSVPEEEDTAAAPSYQPMSPGALPQDIPPEDDLIFEDEETNLPRRPSTAISRSEARKEAPLPETETAPAEALPGDSEEDLATGSISPVDAIELDNMPAERLNRRIGAIEGRPRPREENPYAPLGLRVGTFTVVPTLEQGLTTTSNADASPDGGSAILSETTLRLNAASDWSRHSALIDAYGTYRKSVSGEEVSEFEGNIRSALELDLGSDLRALSSLEYGLRPESASSPVIITGVEDRPLRHTIQGSLGVEKDVGRLRLGLTGEVVRDQYGDATLTDGTELSQSDRNSTLALTRLRGGYQLSPALMPFIEVEAGRRFYDETFDSSGYERSATRLGARGGIELNIEEKLTGELSAGWISEDFDDDRLASISGPSLTAALAWSPMRGTTVRLDGSTIIEGTTSAGESGSILYTGALTLQREMRSNLTGTALIGAAWRDYDIGGQELTLVGEAGLTWWLNRYAGLTGRLRHERLLSDFAGRDYEVSSAFLGIKLQR